MAVRDVLVVVHKGDHSLGYYDLETGTELAHLPLDPYPHEFAVTADHRYAFMAHFGVALAEDEGPGGDTVSVVDIPARKRVATLSCGPHRRPHGIALDASGRLYVLSEADGVLLTAHHPQDGGALAPAGPTGGDGSHIVTVTGDGGLAFCSNMKSDTVSIVRPGDPAAAPVVIPVGERPEGSVLSVDESRLYVTCRESSILSVIDTNSLAALDPLHTRGGPVRVCRDVRGRLLVALYHDRSLALIDPAEADDQVFVALPGQPISASYDAANGYAFLSLLKDGVCVVDLHTGQVVREIETRTDPDPCVLVRLDPDRWN